MGISQCIAALDKSFSLETDYFLLQLKSKWPDVHIHFWQDADGRQAVQWHYAIADYDSMLGDFYGSCVWFQGGNEKDVAQFALWYRKIVEIKYRLIFYDSALSHQVIEIKAETTEQDFLRAFGNDFDQDELEQLLASASG